MPSAGAASSRRNLRGDLLQQLQILELQLVGENRNAGEIATRPAQTPDYSGLYWVATDADDWDRARGLLRSYKGGRRPGDEYVDLPTEKIGNEGGILLRPLRQQMFDKDVLSVDVPVLAQTLPDRLRVVVSRSVGEWLENPDAPDFSGLLRLSA